MTTAVIPVKSLGAGKSRLLPELPRDLLDALCLAMLEDLIANHQPLDVRTDPILDGDDRDMVLVAQAPAALRTQFRDPF